MHDYISAKEICRKLGIDITTLWAWRRDGYFPDPFELGPGGGIRSTTRWRVMDVDAWEENRDRREPGPRIAERLEMAELFWNTCRRLVDASDEERAEFKREWLDEPS